MKEQTRVKIAVLDDSQFYNALLTQQLNEYAASLSKDNGFRLEVATYLSPKDFLHDLEGTDLAFIDYYLGDGVTASDIMSKVKSVAPDCEVVIISKKRNLSTIKPLWKGASQFIYKDGGSLIQSCLLLKDFVHRRFHA